MKYSVKIKRKYLRTLIICFLLILLSCASIKDLVNIKKPVLSFHKVQLTGISFNDVNLRFDIKIENPNPMSATLYGLDYELLIDWQKDPQNWSLK